MKIVSRKKLTDDDLNALTQEIKILGSLNHPHIIKFVNFTTFKDRCCLRIVPKLIYFRLFETFDEGSEIYIVTEIVEGGELFDRIVQKTNYTEKEARDLIKILLETLAYLSDNGIVHRDMKPENLLLCSGILQI